MPAHCKASFTQRTVSDGAALNSYQSQTFFDFERAPPLMYDEVEGNLHREMINNSIPEYCGVWLRSSYHHCANLSLYRGWVPIT